MRRVQTLLTERRLPVLAGLSLALVASALVAILAIQSGPVATVTSAPSAEEATSGPGPLRLPTPWRVPPTPGWVTYRSPDGAYAVAIPPEWTALSGVDQEAQDRVVALAVEMPGWDSYLEAVGEAGLWQEIEVVAVGPDAARFTVSRQAMPQAVSLDFYASLIEAQIASLGAAEVTVEETALSGQDARRIGFQLSFLDESDREIEVRGELYLALQSSDVYVLTFTSPQDLYSRYEPVFGEMAARFSLQSEAPDQESGDS